MAGRDRKRISRAEVPAFAGVSFVCVGKAVPAASPCNGIRRGRASLRCGRSTPIESRCPPLSPAFLGVRVPADGMAIAGQAI